MIAEITAAVLAFAALVREFGAVIIVGALSIGSIAAWLLHVRHCNKRASEAAAAEVESRKEYQEELSSQRNDLLDAIRQERREAESAASVARERFYNRVEDKIEKHENKIEARMDRSDGEIALLAAADSEIRGSVQNIEGYLAALLKKPLPKG